MFNISTNLLSLSLQFTVYYSIRIVSSYTLNCFFCIYNYLLYTMYTYLRYVKQLIKHHWLTDWLTDDRQPAGAYASNGWCCHHWTSVTLRATPARSPTSIVPRSPTFYHGTSAPAGPSSWYNPPGLSPGCWVATCLVRWRWYSNATDMRWCFEPCVTAHRPAAVYLYGVPNLGAAI